MSRFGDNATGPSNLEISNISGVSSQINTLAGYTTELSNLGTVSAEIALLGTAAVVEDLGFLGTQATVDDMAALADVTTELGLLGTTTMTGYITDLATSTVGATTQLSIDALGQLVTEIGLLGNNLTTLQNSAANSPIQLDNLSDVDFGGNTPSLGNTIVYTANNKFELQALPGAGPLSGTNLTETSPVANQILKITSVTNGVPDYVNTDVTALVYDAGFDNITEVAAATPSLAGEVVRYDGTSAWTVGKLDYSELLGTPTNVSTFTNDANYLTSVSSNSVYAHLSSSTTVTFDSATGQFSIPQSVATTANVTFNNLDVDGILHLNHATPASGTSTITGPATMVLDPYTIGAETGLVEINGDLRVLGDTTTISSQTLTVSDQEIVVAQNASPSISTWNNAGLTVHQGTSDDPYIRYTDNGTVDAWNLNRPTILRGDGTSADGQLTINCSANTHGVTIEGPQHDAGFTDYTLKLPDAAPSAGQMLVAGANYATDNKLEFVAQPAAGATVGVAAAMAIVF